MKSRTRRLTLMIGAGLVALTLVSMLAPTARMGTTINVPAGDVAALRQAINNANSETSPFVGADTINLASGATYTLTDFVDATDGQNGLPSITSQITIQGNGATIRRDPSLTCNLGDSTLAATEFRVFHVSGTGNLTLNNVTVSDGCVGMNAANFTVASVGGGLFSNSGTVTVNTGTFSNNRSCGGGGLTAFGGTATITASTFSSNSTPSCPSLATTGGAIWKSNNTMNITNSTISGNNTTSTRDGGGIFNLEGMVTITGSTISGNTATSEGGGIYNTSGDNEEASAILTIINSTISGNSAPVGGGINNKNTEIGSGFNAEANISFSTITLNKGTTSSGGLYNNDLLTIKNSMVAESTSGGNCLNDGGTFTALGKNLDTDGTCAMLDADFTQKTPAELNLGLLQVNAPGATATHALGSGSVAIDAATNCTDVGNMAVMQDQRGVSRPQGTNCDVGAYEAQPQPAGTVFTLQGKGVCLTLNLQTHQYSFKTPRGTFTGPLVSRQRGNTLWFENGRGDNKLMRAWINFVNGTASAVLILPRLLGGGRFMLNDPNFADNGPCP